MGLDPSSPEMTFLLVMLHTGTMFAVIAYFWKAWSKHYFSRAERLRDIIVRVVIATAVTGVIGLGLQFVIEKIFLKNAEKAEVEQLFSQLPLIGAALLAAGILIIYAGIRRDNQPGTHDVRTGDAWWIGLIQGFCLPFRGFSRSGATISLGMLLGVEKIRAEEFSFALAVVLTPAVIAKEWLRLLKAHSDVTQPSHLVHLAGPGLFGMVCSFVAGLLALWLLSSWLEHGRWRFFGYYCVVAAIVVFGLASTGL